MSLRRRTFKLNSTITFSAGFGAFGTNLFEDETGTVYTAFVTTHSSSFDMLTYRTNSESTAVYMNTSGWTDEKYRTIRFLSELNDEYSTITVAELEAWLAENAEETTRYAATKSEITSIADAIRTKGGTSEPLEFPEGFVEAIGDIQAGSETEALSITENGTYTAPTGKAYSPITVNVPKYPVRVTDTIDEHGGTVRSIEVYGGDVEFIDYDGAVIATKSKAEINAMTSDSDLPANPTHEGLTAQGWNWTVAQLKAQLTAMPNQKVYVGQMYVTTSGATEIDVVMQEGRLSPILTICVNGTISVDWGDSTTPDSVTGTSLTTRLDVPHIYASAGSYTIKISGNVYAFYGSASYTLLRKNTTTNENRVYANTIKKVRLGNNVYLRNYAFYDCQSLTSITIPSSIASIGNYAFNTCYSLASITIPSNVTSIGGSVFSGCSSLANITIPSSVTSIDSDAFYCCYSLTSITIPSSVTSISSRVFSYCYVLSSITISNSVPGISSSLFNACNSLVSITMPSSATGIANTAFQNCQSLASIIIPSSVTSIGNNAFQNCYSLASIIIPSSVTSIGDSAFQNCCGMAEYHFQRETPPTGGTYMFSSISSDCVIYVPYSADHSILESYKTATNWSTYASYMQEEPQ